MAVQWEGRSVKAKACVDDARMATLIHIHKMVTTFLTTTARYIDPLTLSSVKSAPSETNDSGKEGGEKKGGGQRPC